jgi:glycosyltransferase involved in cell wall biosynthesis
MKLSLLIPTFNSAATIERTLRAALAQRWRPLEVLVYDEASSDGTREIVSRLLAGSSTGGLEAELRVSDVNSGPVRAWRVPLHRATGDWCCFVWADDVLEPTFSEKMMDAAGRAASAGRVLVFSGAVIEADGREITKYAPDEGFLSPLEFSLGIFFRRYSVNQINGVYETAAARRIFDRHIDIENPMGWDFSRFPYGNDTGFLSELAEAGGGVELLGDRLVRLVASGGSMTRDAMASRLWQFRWQYTWNLFRIWREWEGRGVPGAARIVRFARRRLDLCEAFLPAPRRSIATRSLLSAARSGLDLLCWDWEVTGMSFARYRRRVTDLAR